MKKILLLKTGSSFPEVCADEGDFEQLFLRQITDSDCQVTVFNAVNGEALPELENYAAVIITGSHHMVSDREAWSEALVPYIREMVERNLYVLGVCYGHQLLAHALGGEAGFHPQGPEVGTHKVELNDAGQQDLLLRTLPTTFYAHLTHSQSALAVPEGATVLAANEHEPHQAFRMGERIWGVQFHPEFSATVTRCYIDNQIAALRESGQNPEKLYSAVVETPQVNALINRFIEIAIA